MSIEIKVPKLPESVADATLVAWHRKPGESVRRDENLVDLETDKVVLEVPAPADGVLKEIVASDGAVVTSGQVLAVLEPRADDGAKAAPPPQPARAEQAAEPASAARAAEDGAQKMGPAARKLVDEHDLDASDIAGSGREGRITKADVLSYVAAHGAETAGLEQEMPARRASGGARARTEQRVPMTRLRMRIAERLVEAQHTAAMLTTFNEVDMSAVIELRERYQEQFQARYEIKLGFMPFFIRASIEALRQFPVLNASVDGNEIVYHEFFDIGVAVSTDRGLIVPVLRNAEGLGFAEIERQIGDFGRRARSGELGIDELTGGTFTITNGGVFGSLMSTPILNPPQSGILGMHKIQERAVVVAGEVVARPMMYLALTYDHRVVDGRDAVRFLVHLKEQLEDPARLILQV